MRQLSWIVECVPHVFQHSAFITAFVTAMMLLTEYVNARWNGALTNRLRKGGLTQLAVAATLGATPGCLGAFVVTSLFMRRRMTIGATIAAMIATSGDEAFVMFTMFPKRATALTIVLAMTGISAGWIVDRVSRRTNVRGESRCDFVEEHKCECLPKGATAPPWKDASPVRWTVFTLLALTASATAFGLIGPTSWDWKRITLLLTISVSLSVVMVVPETFLYNHLIRHVLARHVPRIMAWTFGTLWIVTLVHHEIDVVTVVSNNRWSVLSLAAATGLIPESGPHLTFTIMYAEKTLPFSVLLTNSIVQDGHGMLPLMAYSKKLFFLIKGVNLIVGIIMGTVLLALSQ